MCKKEHVTNINLKKIPKWYEDINVKPFSFSFNTALFLGTSSQRSSWLEISISVDSTNASVDLPMTWNLYEQLASSSQKMQIIMWKKNTVLPSDVSFGHIAPLKPSFVTFFFSVLVQTKTVNRTAAAPGGAGRCKHIAVSTSRKISC